MILKIKAGITWASRTSAPSASLTTRPVTRHLVSRLPKAWPGVLMPVPSRSHMAMKMLSHCRFCENRVGDIIRCGFAACHQRDMENALKNNSEIFGF